MKGDQMGADPAHPSPQKLPLSNWTWFSYFITVFIAAPVSIVTGLVQSPAISNKLGWFGRVFNCQAMRSVHFLSFAWLVVFILAHGVMVFVTGLRQNTNHMFGGVDNASWAGFPLFVLAMAVMVA